MIVFGTKRPWVASDDPHSALVKLYLVATIASALTLIATAVLVPVQSSRLRRGGPFGRTVTGSWGTGGILIIGDLVNQMLRAVSRASMTEALPYLAELGHFKMGDSPFTLD